ncbi:GNAT family N-acetyltransferase [Luteolibacter ambystomatis]|uniref:GNAT family N-acetyltransferase n=1 Tax=Luteolibacter ambystomatis TaxID=2824561 RepID=UPI0036254D45
MTLSNSSVRVLTPDDAAIYRALRLQALWEQPPAFGAQPMDEPPLEVIATRLRADRDECFFGAFDQRELIGTLRLTRYAAENEKHRAYLAGLYVAPRHRRHGHGRALVAAALERAKSDPGLRRVNLAVVTAQKPARHLYESFGFQTSGTELEAFSNAGVYYDEHLMTLDLTGGRGGFLATADAWWAQYFGCRPSGLFAEALTLLPDENAPAETTILFREGGAIARIAPARRTEFRKLLAAGSPAKAAAAFTAAGYEVSGPSFLGYTKSVPRPRHRARPLDHHDASRLFSLRRACPQDEWLRGGCDDEHLPRSGVFTDGLLVAMATADPSDETIAPLRLITDPDYRARGYGRSALAHAVGRVLKDGQLPQLTVPESDPAAMRIAETLGFARYATVLKVKPPA